MLIQKPSDIRSSEITSEALYRNRREFIKTTSLSLAAVAATALLPGCTPAAAPAVEARTLGPYDTNEKLTPYNDVTTYNNYYEFGVNKDDPAANATKFITQPWKISVEGMVRKPQIFDLDDLLKGFTREDRVYRMRCVEGWSMVIPWQGIPFSQIVQRLDPLPGAKYVEFKTILAPDEMPGQRDRILDWPYTEGLRMDEAMNPLTLLTTGLYGKPLPNQDGAPVRMVMPWKYGFKGVKAIAKIRFTDQQPLTAWMQAAPTEYGFYANVNPNVDHPRWSQGTERRIGEFLKRKTLMFNGYSDQVAQMYSGMDLKKYF